MRRQGWEEQLRELDEMGMAFRVVRDRAKNSQGWLRTVRRAVGIPVAEAARQIGVEEREIFRMEHTEGRGVIELQTLRRAAEAVGCDLVYGFTPKEGTLAAMAAGIETLHKQQRADAWARKLEKAKEQRLEAAKKLWKAKEQMRLEEEWQEYWKQWRMKRTDGARQIIPKPRPAVEFWKRGLRKALKTVMRKDGVRVR